ncbi:transmembrane protein 32 [Zalerion maritima]|uniref:Transmembrane protein 32 n=1 Tax=Zalerion maritima TaxID=339359 RepID=A0AAD5WSR0_9PEZI|nr:transmembrane protein 32 [Zalerion maritima]
MTWISKSTTAIGALLLVHACYSAQEHAALQAIKMTTTELPADISIEVLVATLVLSLGLVLSTATLRPVKWHVWAGTMEREGRHAFAQDTTDEKDTVTNPFGMLETRPSFVDIRRHKADFAKWVKPNPQ